MQDRPRGSSDERGDEGVGFAALPVATVALVPADHGSEAAAGGTGTELFEEKMARRSLKVSGCGGPPWMSSFLLLSAATILLRGRWSAMLSCWTGIFSTPPPLTPPPPGGPFPGALSTAAVPGDAEVLSLVSSLFPPSQPPPLPSPSAPP